MDQKTYETGLRIRSEVLGKEYVDNSMKSADDFNRPFQEFVSEYCWGAGWGREGLSKKERSMLNLAMIAILNRPHELKLHIRGALTNGLTKEQIREIFIHMSIYAGIPAGNDAFRQPREVFAEQKKLSFKFRHGRACCVHSRFSRRESRRICPTHGQA